MKNADMPAMPLVDPDKSIPTISNQEHEFIKQCNGAIGLTKREHIAIAAMQGLLSELTASECAGYSVTREDVARQSVQMADALLKALEES